MATEAFTIRADGETVRRLDQLAKQLDRSRNYLVNQAIQEYLDLHAWQIQKIEEGIAAADRDEVIPHEDVMAEMDALIEQRIRAFEDRP